MTKIFQIRTLHTTLFFPSKAIMEKKMIKNFEDNEEKSNFVGKYVV